MSIKSILAVIAVCLLTACATPKYNYMPEAISISEPPIGVERTSTVGDVMVRQGKYKEHDAIYLSVETKPVWAYTLFPGYYLKHGEDEGGEYFFPGGGDDAGRIEKAALADPYKTVMTKKEGNALCVVTAFNVAACGNGHPFERRKKPVLSQDSFQQTLIYSGRVGNKINIGYREFSNSVARPAFNNNVEYDLSESKTIAYKDARLEIIEATNQFITYKVIRNFNDATQ
jgi:hypothetical protein